MGQLLSFIGLIRAVAVGAVTDLRSCTDSNKTLALFLTFNHLAATKAQQTLLFVRLCA